MAVGSALVLTLVAAAALAFRPTTPIDVSVTPTAIVAQPTTSATSARVAPDWTPAANRCSVHRRPDTERTQTAARHVAGARRRPDGRRAFSMHRPVSRSISKPTSTLPSFSTTAFRSYLPAASPWRSGARTATDRASFRDPSGITVDDNGNIYVVERGNNRVQKLAPDGRPLAQWGGSGQLNGPLGLALDTQGNVYVADPGNNRIQKFSSSGQSLQQWGVYGNGTGQFTSPSGIAIDDQGNMYVVDQSNERIQKLAPNGRTAARSGAPAASRSPTTPSS